MYTETYIDHSRNPHLAAESFGVLFTGISFRENVQDSYSF
ncbi:hypothetical protein CLOSYM_03089 [[Clostridium] symbiosum ATCC 14940]|uniref:Uncharacterized protein n=1 Tax=[Clostridium] symbiosum ATCC 14940 TaxID=411472 RepID=A0ABC9TVQ1_CLOSY|nr:hypothetical protein CLOSYM_03089 [[Clostridium] symbiosum ATCC 14940]